MGSDNHLTRRMSDEGRATVSFAENSNTEFRKAIERALDSSVENFETEWSRGDLIVREVEDGDL